jgi:hypothetical protein
LQALQKSRDFSRHALTVRGWKCATKLDNDFVNAALAVTEFKYLS